MGFANALILTLRYSEVCKHNYQFGSPGTAATGHFTQVVWKSSAEMGMATASFKKGNLFCAVVIALYSPAGNFMGQWQSNVLAGYFDKKKCKDLKSLLGYIDKSGEGAKNGKKENDDKVVQDSRGGNGKEGEGNGEGDLGAVYEGDQNSLDMTSVGNAKFEGSEGSGDKTVEDGSGKLGDDSYDKDDQKGGGGRGKDKDENGGADTELLPGGPGENDKSKNEDNVDNASEKIGEEGSGADTELETLPGPPDDNGEKDKSESDIEKETKEAVNSGVTGDSKGNWRFSKVLCGKLE